MGYFLPPYAGRTGAGAAAERGRGSGVANWSKIGFVVDFRNLLFGRDFDLSFSKGYSLMKYFNL